jgi:prepilin-type N-terminal cleavage/methylation domain-containing protein
MPFSIKNDGFSMLEIFVTLAIVSILTLIMYPTLRPFLENIRLRTTATTIKQQLNLAKTRALGDPNIHAGVFLDTTGAPDATFVFSDDDATSMNDNQYIAGKDRVLTPQVKVPKSDTLKIISTYPNVIVFRGDGSAKTSAKFVISNKYGRCDTISVLASTGRIKLTRNF